MRTGTIIHFVFISTSLTCSTFMLVLKIVSYFILGLVTSEQFATNICYSKQLPAYIFETHDHVFSSGILFLKKLVSAGNSMMPMEIFTYVLLGITLIYDCSLLNLSMAVKNGSMN